jgi:hypothetical protein
MSDIEQLLARTGQSYDVPPSADVVEADIRRGRSAALRRRRRRAIGSSVASTVAVTAIVGAAIIVGSPGETGGTPATGPAPAPAQPDSVQGQDRGVRLVAYTGEQPEGFFVDQVPEGWYIQEPEHGAYSLAIAPEGDTSHPDDYVGKLVVMLYTSTGPQKLPTWGDPEPVVVNGEPGVVTRNDPAAATLTFYYPDGRLVQVQAWRTLGWSNDQLVEFAEGVTVTADAKAGVG